MPHQISLFHSNQERKMGKWSLWMKSMPIILISLFLKMNSFLHSKMEISIVLKLPVLQKQIGERGKRR
jgi:hypothetical protein